jgi:DNA polymerase V
MTARAALIPLRLRMSDAPPDLLPLMGARVCAGFPSPADDYVEAALDPAQLIVTNPISTFLWRVAGSSMIGAGINDGDYVVVDRSLKVKAGDVVVAIIDSLPSVKRVRRFKGGRLGLDFDNPTMATLMMDEAGEAEIWGVVTWSLTAHRAPTP